ncbi:MAG: phosphoribosylaminoimidazolesuccinocarboxamide synthase, partial [Guyparkeria sp.]
MTHSVPAVFETQIDALEPIHRGKVRDLYRIDDERMLIVTTDRVSAFDVILPTPIPDKGRVLTEISRFWFEKSSNLVPNHLCDDQDLAAIVPDGVQRAQLEGRSVIVRNLEALPIEAVVRGYLIGSGYKDYQATGAVCGITLPDGLRLADRLPEPIYTPATKADVGDHDENIDFAETEHLIGPTMAAQVRDTAMRLYRMAADFAAERG